MERNQALFAIEKALDEHTAVFVGSQDQLGWPEAHHKICGCDQREMSQEEAKAHMSVAILESLLKSGLSLSDCDDGDLGASQRGGPSRGGRTGFRKSA